MKDVYLCLSATLYEVYRPPLSSSGIERNHKVDKRVQTARRGSLVEGKVEKQVAVAHKKCQLGRQVDKKGGEFEHVMESVNYVPCDNAENSSSSSPQKEVEAELGSKFLCNEEEELELESVIISSGNQIEILDSTILIDEDF